MKHISAYHIPRAMITAVLALGLLAACASQPAYRAADGRGFGYAEQQLTQDQYRITFKARGDNVSQAMDYAMLRASELTMERERDWFDVVSRDTLVDRQRVSPGVSTGIGISYGTGRFPGPFYQTGIHMGDSRREVEVIMQIRMGSGMRPDGDSSYDAREVYQNLSPANS